MKKVFFIGLLAVILMPQVQAQKEKIPQVVLTTFEKQHPGQKATWNIEKDSYKVTFVLNGKHASENYRFDGKRVASEIEIKQTELPVLALKYMTKNHPKSKIVETSKITDLRKGIFYEIVIKIDNHSKDLLFDSKGNFIKIE